MALIKKTALGFRKFPRREGPRCMAPSAFGCGVNCTNGCIVATRDSLSRILVKLAWGLLFSLDPVHEQLLILRNLSGPGRQLMRKCMPLSSFVAISRILIATRVAQECGQVFAPRCTGPKHPGPWWHNGSHFATHTSFRSVRSGCEALSFSTNICSCSQEQPQRGFHIKA